jgi:hypothetical protein
LFLPIRQTQLLEAVVVIDDVDELSKASVMRAGFSCCATAKVAKALAPMSANQARWDFMIDLPTKQMACAASGTSFTTQINKLGPAGWRSRGNKYLVATMPLERSSTYMCSARGQLVIAAVLAINMCRDTSMSSVVLRDPTHS